MGIEISPVATNQTVSGQPAASLVDVPPVVTEGGEAAPAAEPVVTEGGAAPVTPVTVDIAPEALRQITGLSTANRTLKATIAELTAKLAAKEAVTPEDVTAKLAELAALQGETPRQYLKRTGKTLEDVAQDVLADDTVVADPRVDALAPEIEALKKKLEEREKLEADNKAKAEGASIAARMEQGKAHVNEILKSNPERWELIQDNADIAAEVIKAAMLVADRDYVDKQTGQRIPISQEKASEIVAECLDAAETYALAKKLQADKKTVAESSPSLVKKRGLDVVDSESYASRKGDDGKQVGNARTPKVTLDDNRGALRGQAVKRGPTDVRTARARMLKIAQGGGDE